MIVRAQLPIVMPIVMPRTVQNLKNVILTAFQAVILNLSRLGPTGPGQPGPWAAGCQRASPAARL